ncbi:MAG: HupE/UreJ family protein [Parvularculaceae bacterium]|nr:HupE/UreJ family protein [Parvularculaceae bacterium]
MQGFPVYLQLGFEHILDVAGIDHILFLVALCASYRFEQWRSLTVLVTAFTLGHSVTLALAATGTLTIPSSIIEFLIPTTILATAIHNVVSKPSERTNFEMRKNYAMALFFGFIHGMGFSNFFRALLMGDSSIFVPLLGFNIGIEFGQLIIVGGIVGIAYGVMRYLKVQHREWNLFISGGAAGLAIYLMFQAKFW